MCTLYDPLYAALVGGLIGAIGTWVAVVYQGRLNAKADQLAMKVTVQALWNVGTDFVLVPFAIISYALGDEAGAHEAIAA